MFGIDWSLSLTAVIAFIAIGLFLSVMILYARAKLISTKPCHLFINSNESLTKEVPSGQTLLSALSSSGIAVPSPCGGKATCKQCRVQVVEGGGDILETDRATFSPKELKSGWRLSCQCKVKDDMALKLPEAYLTLREFKGRVVSNQNVATFIKELVIEVDEADLPEYRPGDYLQFHVPPYKTNTSDWKQTMEEKYFHDWETFNLFGVDIDYSKLDEEVIRAYSMASYPLEGNILKFNIRIASPPFVKGKMMDAPWGICSSYLFSLKQGDEVQLSGPFGESHMIHDDRELIFLIGGAGSSFGRSHILDLFLHKKAHRKITLWYGARSLKENIYQDDFEKLAKERENFAYRLVLSEPLPEDIEAGWPKDDPVKTGFLFKAFQVGMLDTMEEPENALYYVCGPPMHNASVMKLLDNYGVERDSIILDDFGS
ncbi:MAG: NADH:ubiquinone reductase (Na(+)-transporting) subunit F [Simkaniaceae bacterium]|nr:NADH:ubiquinone reductase (Na(+)-transporting) subunit F [Simkaniaceae bacterium]